uniref:Uncharacterized protein n=1 Tax=Trichogramma kaykai TaxID=54128 RepID=A0ABD2XNT7_9HYME
MFSITSISTNKHRIKKIVQVLSITVTKSLFNKKKEKIRFIWLDTQHGLRVVQSNVPCLCKSKIKKNLCVNIVIKHKGRLYW